MILKNSLKLMLVVISAVFFTFLFPILVTSSAQFHFGISTICFGISAALYWISTIGEDSTARTPEIQTA